MAAKAIQIGDVRILFSTIKRYKCEADEKRISIYYAATRNRIDCDVFRFDTEQDYTIVRNELDDYFL